MSIIFEYSTLYLIIMYKKNGIILYFDILGYKNIVTQENENEKTFLRRILDNFSTQQCFLNFALSYGESFYKNKRKVFVRAFSDNFLHLYECEDYSKCLNKNQQFVFYHNLKCMIGLASIIQTQFLKSGILTRGSITFGTIYYNHSLIFGESIVRAVDLENGHREPSILIDKTITEKLKKDGFEVEEYCCPFFTHPDSFLDYNELINGVNKWLLSLQSQKINDEKEKEKLLMKINWLLNEMSEYFSFENIKKYNVTDSFKLEIIG